MLDYTSQPTLAVDQIKIRQRARRDLGDVESLAADIDAIGLLQPIVVNASGELIAGARRIAAWKQSRFKDLEIPARVVDLRAIARGEWSENIYRKAFTPSEMVALARELEPIFRQEAAARKKAGVKAAPGTAGAARDRLAALTGISRRSLEKALHIVTAADRDASLAPLVDKMDRTGKIDGVFRQLQKRTRVKRGAQSILIGKVPLEKFTAPELRWLFALCGYLAERMPIAPSDGCTAVELFNPETLAAARRKADKARTDR